MTYTFGEFELEAENLLLLKNSEVVPLAPKACEILLTLIEADGKLISKREILDKVWANSFVEETNLTHHISALRRALGEDKNGRRFIETIPRRGYRFIAPVSQKRSDAPPPNELVITERVRIHAVEAVQIETDDFVRDKSSVDAPIDDPTRTKVLSVSKNGHQTRRSPRTVPIFIGVGLLLTVALFFGWRMFWIPKKAAVLPAVKRLTPDADVRTAAISPDGTSIAFITVENERYSMWRKSVVTGEMTQLLPASMPANGRAISLHFSPDGQWIYYQASNPEVNKISIFRIPAAGGTAQVVAIDVVTDFAISPDGKRIVFARSNGNVIVFNSEDGEDRVVAESSSAGEQFSPAQSLMAAWSPDGKRIVIPGKKSAPGGVENLLVEINVETKARSLVPLPKDFEARQVQWLPDGTALLVTRITNPALPTQIWRISYPDGAVELISPPEMSVGQLRLSADGKSLVALQRIGNYNIWLAPTDDMTQRRQISVGAAARHGIDGLAYLPDGNILYTSTQSGNLDLWTMDESGDNRRQLTVNAGTYNGMPAVTRDKRYIVFFSNRSGSKQVWRMDPDGRNPVQLTQKGEHTAFQLAPDNWIYLIERLPEQKKLQVYKVSVENGERAEVDNNLFSTFPYFSPDRKWAIGYPENAPNKYDLIDTTTNKPVRQLESDIDKLSWWYDSKSLAHPDKLRKKLIRMPIDGSQPYLFADFSPNAIFNYDFSPDGKKMVFALGDWTEEVVLLQNFSEPK